MNSDGWAAKAQHGMVTATRCGIGLWSSDMYSSFGAGVTGQYNGVDLVLGSNPESVFGGTDLQALYTEKEQVATIVHVAQITGSDAVNGSTIHSISALLWEKMVSLGWRSVDGSLGSNTVAFPVSMQFDTEWVTPSDQPGIVWGTGSDKGTHVVYSAPKENAVDHAYIVRGGGRLFLRDNAERRTLRGVKPTHFTVYGDGDVNEYDHAFTVECDEGYTVNGQPFDQPLVTPELYGPVTFHALLGKDFNWIVTATPHQVL